MKAKPPTERDRSEQAPPHRTESKRAEALAPGEGFVTRACFAAADGAVIIEDRRVVGHVVEGHSATISVLSAVRPPESSLLTPVS
jgi:hypothetical protein